MSQITGSKILSHLDEIRTMQWWDQKKIQAFQKQALKRLLKKAYIQVPYYHSILKTAGVVEENKVIIENFNNIPVLTKDIIRTNFENLKNSQLKSDAFINHSGGSTGQPLEFIQDKHYQQWNIANKIFYKTNYGNKQIGEKELRLWGAEEDILSKHKGLKYIVRDFLYNRKDLNAFLMTSDNIDKYIIAINQFKPKWIEAYVQPIYELSKYVLANRISLHNPKGIITSAGSLYLDMKNIIEEAFNCPVFNRYGSREVGDIACSCSKTDHLHISFWNNYVETQTIDEFPNKVLVTNLNNYSMPLIRYDIGDVAEIEDSFTCECGRRMPTFKKIEGRQMSVFRKKDGGIVPAEFFIHFVGVVHNDGNIKKFQVIQDDFDQITIKIVMDKNASDCQHAKNKIEESIKGVMGANCNIKWKEVRDIPPLKSGKYLYTLSKVK